MRLFGYEISLRKAPPTTLSPVFPSNRGQWGFGTVGEPFPGAWQKNIEIRLENVLTFSTVYACVTLIASDIGKLHLRYVVKDENGIWMPKESPSFSPVLRKPNHYQIRQKFIEQWITSKLINGNTYVLKERDERNVVTKLYVLDPCLVKPLVATNGDVFYQLNTNLLAGITTAQFEGVDNRTLVVPASEVIHDVMVPLYHPLCGVSPITACGLAAMQGLRIQEQSVKFFENGSRPGGVLTAPGLIEDATAKRIKEHWDNNFSGANSGKVAVLGDGLTYSQMQVSAVDADLINQLKMSSEQVCSAFHVPAFMVNVGPPPSYNNIEALYQQYYSQCLQTLMESIEVLLDYGLGLLGPDQSSGTEFDLDDLLKMDTSTQYKTYGDGISRGLLSPNEARKKLGLPPVPGGDSPFLQQQNYSLEALGKRDSKDDPFATKTPAATPAAKPPKEEAPPPQKLLPAPELHTVEFRAILDKVVKHASI